MLHVISHNVCESCKEGYNEDWLNVVEDITDMREEGRTEASQDAKRLRNPLFRCNSHAIKVITF